MRQKEYRQREMQLKYVFSCHRQLYRKSRLQKQRVYVFLQYE